MPISGAKATRNRRIAGACCFECRKATPSYGLAIFEAICLVKTLPAHKFAPARHNHGDNLARACYGPAAT
jgi:hypothetical protein